MGPKEFTQNKPQRGVNIGGNIEALTYKRSYALWIGNPASTSFPDLPVLEIIAQVSSIWKNEFVLLGAYYIWFIFFKS